MIKNLEKIFTDSQAEIIKSFTDLEKSKNAKIVCDSWKRPEGGGGKTFIIQGGNFFDNCAVNFSSIREKTSESSSWKPDNEIFKLRISGYGRICYITPKKPQCANQPYEH